MIDRRSYMTTKCFHEEKKKKKKTKGVLGKWLLWAEHRLCLQEARLVLTLHPRVRIGPSTARRESEKQNKAHIKAGNKYENLEFRMRGL